MYNKGNNTKKGINGQIGQGQQFNGQKIKRDGVIVSRGGQNGKMCSVYVGIGERIEIKGVRYECIRSCAGVPCEACLGCDLRRDRVNCMGFQCSPFDREDGEFTWFRRVGDMSKGR